MWIFRFQEAWVLGSASPARPESAKCLMSSYGRERRISHTSSSAILVKGFPGWAAESLEAVAEVPGVVSPTFIPDSFRD